MANDTRWQWASIDAQFPVPAAVTDDQFHDFATESELVKLLRAVTRQELRRYPDLLAHGDEEFFYNQCLLLLWQVICSPTWRRKAEKLNSLSNALFSLFHEWARAESDRLFPGPSSQARRLRALIPHRDLMAARLGRPVSDQEVIDSYNAKKRSSLRDPDRDSSVYARLEDLQDQGTISLDAREYDVVTVHGSEEPSLADGEAAALVQVVLADIPDQLLRDLTEQWLSPIFARRPGNPASTEELAEQFGLDEGAVAKVIAWVRPRFVAALEHHGWGMPEALA